MVEPVFTERPPEPIAAHVAGVSAPAIHGPSWDVAPGSDNDVLGAGSAHEDIDQRLHAEVAQLRRAMQTRPPIDKSMGVLMAAYSLSEDEAWKTLVTVSQHTNTKLYSVAEKIVASTQEDVVDARLRQTLKAALRELKNR